MPIWDGLVLMKWNVMESSPRCQIKAHVTAIRLCDCIGNLIASPCPLWLWSSCNFPASPFSSPAALKWWTQTTSCSQITKTHHDTHSQTWSASLVFQGVSINIMLRRVRAATSTVASGWLTTGTTTKPQRSSGQPAWLSRSYVFNCEEPERNQQLSRHICKPQADGAVLGLVLSVKKK